MSKKRKFELSKEVHKLLVELCGPYGSQKEAQKDPNFVLVELLKALNEDKRDVSSCTTTTLDWGIGSNHLESIKEEAAEQKQLQPA